MQEEELIRSPAMYIQEEENRFTSKEEASNMATTEEGRETYGLHILLPMNILSQRRESSILNISERR